MNNSPAVRLDVAVAEKTGVSRTLARDLIESGRISVAGKIIKKSGVKIPSDAEIVIEAMEKTFVGRGGFKLQKALEVFQINTTGLICMDVGASTGGFTDCLLQNGAGLVYSIDSGKNQLKDEIKRNPKVVSMEETDVRALSAGDIKPVDFLCADVSFISLDKIVDSLYNLMKPGAAAILLVKPQFEAGPGMVNKKGVIKSSKTHYKILLKVYNYTKNAGFSIRGLCQSPITGGEGNREFLLYIVKHQGGGLDINGFEKLLANVTAKEK